MPNSSCLNPLSEDVFEPDTIFLIRLIYIITIIVWIVIVFYFNFYRIDFPGQLILSIPPILFLIAIINADGHTTAQAHHFFNSSILYFLFLAATILINWFKDGYRKRIYRAIIISIFFVVISLINFWVSEEHLIYIIHLRTISNTIAIVLLAYALYLRYRDNIKAIDRRKENETN